MHTVLLLPFLGYSSPRFGTALSLMHLSKGFLRVPIVVAWAIGGWMEWDDG